MILFLFYSLLYLRCFFSKVFSEELTKVVASGENNSLGVLHTAFMSFIPVFFSSVKKGKSLFVYSRFMKCFVCIVLCCKFIITAGSNVSVLKNAFLVILCSICLKGQSHKIVCEVGTDLLV
jgi:hypothetical protein